jgi:glycosyltransferase involved in cell wall biosynthesis
VAWNWSTDYLNQTAFELARRGYIVVCYLWGDTLYLKNFFRFTKHKKIIEKYSDNIYALTPFFLIPFRRFRFIANLNSNLNIVMLKFFTEIICFYKNCTRRIFWIFDPNLYFIYSFFGKNYYLLYDCVDFFAVGNKKNISRAIKNEQKLTTDADLVVANSTVLQKRLSSYRKNVPLVSQGFRIEDFAINKRKYIDLKLKGPVIGFVGGINNRLDTVLLLNLIKNNPKWNFVLWGPLQKDLPTGDNKSKEINLILSLPNVVTGVSIDKDEIPGIVSQFDVGMIPYDSAQDFNKYCYPMKLLEYFYLGKPVISTTIMELFRFPELIKIGDSYKDWQVMIENLLSKKWPKVKIQKELKIAKENSWEEKIRQITSLISVF